MLYAVINHNFKKHWTPIFVAKYVEIQLILHVDLVLANFIKIILVAICSFLQISCIIVILSVNKDSFTFLS